MADDICDYAACNRPAARSDAGWEFCPQHYREHRADMYGEPWPRMAAVNPREVFGLAAHGTQAALRRHHRRGERPCETCLVADFVRRNPNGGFWRGRTA